ncbi:MAG: hypothetical protein JWO36_6701 [Myxococcales bacterium]|nr:hypothetical protein [Myxococcales bacterium]
MSRSRLRFLMFFIERNQYRPPAMGKFALCFVVFAACASTRPNGQGSPDASGGSGGDGGGSQTGCGGLNNCYSVYAHSNDTLYVVDLQAKTLQLVGKFNAPMNDVITDLAVAPDNTIYVISNTVLYTASATDGHVTKVGTLAACGMKGVALTVTPGGQLWTGDFMGALCQIDLATNPPTVKPPVRMQGGMALSGDLVAINDGTVYGTAYKLTDAAGQGTQMSNDLVKINLTTGAVTMVGATGYPKLFGTSFAENFVIGFTHDATGHVVKIDPTTGASTIFATFMDPTTSNPISFAGAGVNALVSIIQ